MGVQGEVGGRREPLDSGVQGGKVGGRKEPEGGESRREEKLEQGESHWTLHSLVLCICSKIFIVALIAIV